MKSVKKQMDVLKEKLSCICLFYYILQKIHNYSIKLGKKEWIKALASYLSTLMSWILTKCTYKVTNRKIGKLLKLSYVDGYL